MDKFFKFIDRVNALAFFAGVVTAVCLIIWAIGSSVWNRNAKTTVIVSNAAAEKSEVLNLTAWEFIPETGVQVLKLQSTGGESNDYASEGRNYKARNLLFVRTDGGNSTWLFPDQSHLISRVERLTAPDGRTKAIYFESRPAIEKSGPQFSLYLAKPDGTSPHEVLSLVNQVITKQISGDSAYFIYLKSLEIKLIKISIKTLQVESESVLAKVP